MIPLVLASTSESRKTMLCEAGVAFEALAPDVDEETMKKTLIAQRATPKRVAEALADAKALAVSAKRTQALVLGADQVLVAVGRLYSKAANMEEAAEILKSLRGITHELISAASLAKNGKIVWRHTQIATLAMRPFSDTFLADYLAKEGRAVLMGVGCYRIEGLGAQLFARVEGDQFTIRGLPMFAVLEALRAQGALAS